MDASTNFSLTQLILVWTLLGFLLTWMLVFAVLAMRWQSHEILAEEEEPTLSTPHPVVSMLPKLHSVTSSPRQVAAETVNGNPSIPSEAMAGS